jgi:hypothetical protein
MWGAGYARPPHILVHFPRLTFFSEVNNNSLVASSKPKIANPKDSFNHKTKTPGFLLALFLRKHLLHFLGFFSSHIDLLAVRECDNRSVFQALKPHASPTHNHRPRKRVAWSQPDFTGRNQTHAKRIQEEIYGSKAR